MKTVDIRARIGGIKELSDLGQKSLLKRISWLLIIYAVLCYTCYYIVDPIGFVFDNMEKRERIISPSGSTFIGILMSINAMVAIFIYTILLELQWNFYKFFLGSVALLFIGGIFSVFFKPKKQNITN